MTITRTINQMFNHVLMRSVALAFILAILVNTLILNDPAPDLVTFLLGVIIFLGVTNLIKDRIRIGEYPSVFAVGFIVNISYVAILVFTKMATQEVVWEDQLRQSIFFGAFTIISYLIITKGDIPWLTRK